MPVGRLQQHWRGNCIAIGLAQGFIEPLEATALMLVHYGIYQLSSRLGEPVR
ncbi:tryptophan 7-halogenase [Alteromonas oceani]|uniref:Tryptophan 7-halogenase n=1 Tax=Alteromonas oceani TaxID=2071609 RepID=A0ABV7JZS7_9ALTE|nr:tryptophan 7-halogenase [Alteromonas oceani]